MSKFAETNKKIEDAVVEGYQKIEDGVVGGYKKIEDKFIDTFLARIATGSAVFGAVGVMALHMIFRKTET